MLWGEPQWGSTPTLLQKLGQLFNLFETYFQGVLFEDKNGVK